MALRRWKNASRARSKNSRKLQHRALMPRGFKNTGSVDQNIPERAEFGSEFGPSVNGSLMAGGA
jgi:hypothetical protein